MKISINKKKLKHLSSQNVLQGQQTPNIAGGRYPTLSYCYTNANHCGESNYPAACAESQHITVCA